MSLPSKSIEVSELPSYGHSRLYKEDTRGKERFRGAGMSEKSSLRTDRKQTFYANTGVQERLFEAGKGNVWETGFEVK